MEFICYQRWQDLPASSLDLFTVAQRSSPFFSRLWLESLTDHALEIDKQPLLACVIDGDEVLACLPLMDDGTKELRSLSNRYSALFCLYIKDIGQMEVVTCLAKGLCALPFASIKLEPVAEDDRALQMLCHALQELDYDCQQHARFLNWRHRVDGQSFDEYLAQRPGSVRNTIERKSRRLHREHDVVIRVVDSVDGLQQALLDYGTVYRSSWKQHEPYQALVDAVVHGLAERGEVRLGVLYVDDDPVAAQIWFVTHSIASILRLAYVEAWKPFSPGSILTRHMMQHVIDHDRVSCIDYLMGDESYKHDWMSESRRRVCLQCVRAEVGGGAFGALLSRIKRWTGRN